jgi:CheY-like chemotaxis protein
MTEQHRILLVEDDDDVADAMVAILEGEGYAVVRASDGEQALRALRGGLDPCLIVLDLFMPRMNGIEFRRVQRSDPSISQVPVVVVSGVTDMVDEIRAMGVARCFRKPVDFDKLLGVVNELCPAA